MQLLQKRVSMPKQYSLIRMCTNRMYVARRCSAPLNRLTVSNELTELPLQFFFPLQQTGVISVWRFVQKQLPKNRNSDDDPVIFSESQHLIAMCVIIARKQGALSPPIQMGTDNSQPASYSQNSGKSTGATNRPP